MNRREFSRRVVGATLGMAAGLPTVSARAEKRDAAAGETPFPLSVMLWTVFRGLPFEERLGKIAEAGYHHVELVDEFRSWSDADFAKANRRKRELRLTFDATAGLRHGASNAGERDEFLRDVDGMLATTEKLECPALIVLSGNRVPGVTHEAQHQACVESLKRAAEAAEKRGVTLLLENIDPEENPRYFLTSVAEGFDIVREVGHPRVKFLYDFYHEQIAEGNLIEKLEKNIDLVGVVHIADVPGRHEPGTGEINYANIFKKLAALKFQGYAAMEFLPTGDPVEGLRAARMFAASATRG
ncbi:MAG TPA: TIM barrel protein [Candidatus Limnocylindrales bacterium]|nr:TIM barrel protein [Candidatus Limnocylindrales bacterium]